MPVFDNVDKVIVVPGESSDGCAGWFGLILAMLGIGFVAMVISGIINGLEYLGLKSKPVAPISRQAQPVRPPAFPQRDARPAPPAVAQNFVPLGPRQFRQPFPRPVLLDRAPNGAMLFGWAGRDWPLPPPPRPYSYLCVTNGLQWCWPNPPRPGMRACTRRTDGVEGWCD